MVKLSDIEDSILRDGMKGARAAIEVIDARSTRPSANPKLKTISKQLHDIYSQLDSGFVNKATTIGTYSSQLKHWVRTDSTFQQDMKRLQKDIAQEVLDAKRGQTKSNRIREGHKIISFWNQHKDQIPLLIKFRDLLIDAKVIIES